MGLWPLLSDEDGYWPSEVNVQAFDRRVTEVLAFAADAGVPVQTVAVDLEPPYRITDGLLDPTTRVATATSLAAGALTPGRRRARHEAQVHFRALHARLSRAGIETIAATFPFVAADLTWSRGLFETLLQTPVSSVAWDVVSPMMYTSIIASMMPRRSVHLARRWLNRVATQLATADRGASLSLGVVSIGKLGSEPIFDDPAHLAADVEAARSGGVEDLALFSLEGVLQRGPPEAWLLPFTR